MQFLFFEKDAALPQAMCLYSSDLSYSKEILPMALSKHDPPPQPLFDLFFFNQNIQRLMQSDLQNTRPTNHRAVFVLKQRCSCLLLHCKRILSEIVPVCHLPG